jgi:hypothetical protein
MRKILVTFGGKAYDTQTAITVREAPKLGADEVWVFDDKWLLETGFCRYSPFLYDAEPKRHEGHSKFGFGYCGWKAFVISSALERLKDNDVVFYVDADTHPIGNPFGQVFDACAKAGGVFLFEEQGCSTLRFTKRDCWTAMGLPLKESIIAAGRFSLWQKGSFLAKQMLAEWWTYSINPRCMLWDSSILTPDHPEFARHTTEQSVLSLLAQKYDIPLHRTPDQWGSVPKDYELYQQILLQVGATGNREDVSGSVYRNFPCTW